MAFYTLAFVCRCIIIWSRIGLEGVFLFPVFFIFFPPEPQSAERDRERKS